jgi:hypothetical protein
MRYMLLINSQKSAPPPSKGEMEAIMKGHERFGSELLAVKKMVHGERLRGDDEASRIRFKAGQRQVTDGPFTETKEVLGGFYPDRVRQQGGGDRVGQEDPAHRGWPHRRRPRLADVSKRRS